MNVILLCLLIICYEKRTKTTRVNNIVVITINDDDNLRTKFLIIFRHVGTVSYTNTQQTDRQRRVKRKQSTTTTQKIDGTGQKFEKRLPVGRYRNTYISLENELALQGKKTVENGRNKRVLFHMTIM